MKRIVNNFQFLLIAWIWLPVIHSCKKADFEEKILSPIQVYFSQPAGILEIPLTGTFTKDEANVTVPFEISLSGSSPSAFLVNLSVNQDTILKMIAVGSLPATTVVISANSFKLPSQAEFGFGAKKTTLNITIPTSLLELNFGKKMAVGIQISNPNKGNTINQSKNTVVVLLNTVGIINQQDIHYISFNLGGTSPLIINPANSTIAGSFVNVPLQIDLSGTVGNPFSVNIASNDDTVNTLIANNTLVNTLAIPSGNYVVPGSVKIDFNQSSASFLVQLNTSDLLKNPGKKQAFALTLNNPEKYQVSANKKTIVVVIDPLTILDDVTALLKNTAQPFTFSSLEPVAKRWGKLADWISNDAANNYKNLKLHGSFDANNGSNIALESFAPDRPAITNGKIYQTVTLPAGIYTLSVNLRAGSNAAGQNAYVAVIDGSAMPDAIPLIVTGNSLGYKKFTNTTGAYTVPFTLTQSKLVTIGFCATLTGNNSYNVNNVKLTRQLN